MPTLSSQINRTNLLYIVVRNGEDYGIGQFAIIDSDRDEDGLVDSYEEEHGLNKFFENEPDKDSDRDSLTDKFEAFYGTHPREKDSDEDGYSDGLEHYLDSEPLDPDCNPIDGCASDDVLEPIEQPVAPQVPEEEPEEVVSDNPSEGTGSPVSQDDAVMDTTNSDSGSGGGAIFWLTLALFMLVIARHYHLRRRH